MFKGIQIIMVTFFFLSVQCCPENCKTCNLDLSKCQQCSSGYQLNQKTHLCELNYSNQSQWPGICMTGTKQSPININSQYKTICPYGVQFYQITQTVPTQIKPQGQNLQASYVDQSVVTYIRDETTNTYESLQFHWHSPSEHQVCGQNLDLELHIVHKNSDGSDTLAVTSLFFQVDKLSNYDILDQYDFFADNSTHEFAFPIFLKNKLVYHYEGSLTTPPCTQNVNWFVYTEFFPITESNYKKIKYEINENRPNARYVQNLNDRNIQLVGGFCNPWLTSR